ncbi:MAG: hypothetical protein LBP27_06430, partial [Treponema sp.]|nr:hypothetical protein [Treponema sp.]
MPDALRAVLLAAALIAAAAFVSAAVIVVRSGLNAGTGGSFPPPAGREIPPFAEAPPAKAPDAVSRPRERPGGKAPTLPAEPPAAAPSKPAAASPPPASPAPPAKPVAAPSKPAAVP